MRLNTITLRSFTILALNVTLKFSISSLTALFIKLKVLYTKFYVKIYANIN